jgi:DNA invertase Pin-like site-specific DNA recombinase
VAASSSQRPPAIGYVSGSGKQVDIARHGGAINRACASRGWALAELVRDDETGSSPLHRPGLAAAMERLAAPGPSRLVVSKLAHLSRSAADLTTLFEWFADHDVQVVAADVAIDTTTPEGRDAASARLTAVAQRQAQAHKNGHTNGSNGNGRPEHAGAANGGHAW